MDRDISGKHYQSGLRAGASILTGVAERWLHDALIVIEVSGNLVAAAHLQSAIDSLSISPLYHGNDG
jgi:hypothetical protein